MSKQKECLVTVVIPVYRVEEYLERCVNSVIKQTYKNIEIILVDDGSDDKCPSMCDEYVKKDNRVVVVHKKNGGLSDARNYGIEKAKGKYITFVDSDDYIDEDYVELLLNTLIDNNADISICAYVAKYDNGTCLSQETNKKMILKPRETLEKMLYQEDFNVSTWAKMYKTELFNDISFPVGRIFEDAYTTYKLVMKSNLISCDMKSKYNYMIRANSILTAKFSEKKLLLVDAYHQMGNAVLQKYPDLNDAVNRGNIYSRISTLRQMINCKERMRNIEREYRQYILKNSKRLLLDRRTPKRDKIAVLTLIPGVWSFKICWNIYCKLTGRNM